MNYLIIKVENNNKKNEEIFENKKIGNENEINSENENEINEEVKENNKYWKKG